MSLPRAAARELIDAFRAGSPGACDLAVAAALAVQVEPALLRRARIDLRPGLSAGAESDVWFSPLIASRSTRSVVFEPRVLELLREELAAELGRECGDDEQKLLRYRQVVLDVHAAASPAIRLEEEIVWLALSGGENSPEAIERALQRAIKTMVKQPARATEVARWADRALAYFPQSVRDAAAGQLLATGCAIRLGTTGRLVAGGHATAAGQAAGWLAAGASAGSKVEVRVRRFADALELDTRAAGREPGERLSLAPADAVVLDLFRIEGSQELPLGPATPGPGAWIPLPEGAGDLLLRTVSGEEYRLSLAKTERPGLRVYLSYLAADAERVEEVRQRLESAGHQTLSVDYQDVQGEEWESRVAESIKDADLFVYLITSQDSMTNQLMLRELEVATSRQAHPPVSVGGWIVPVFLADVSILESSPLFGRVVEPRVENADQLLDRIASLTASGADADAAPTPRAVFLSFNARDGEVERVQKALAPLASEGLLRFWDVGSAGNVGGAEERLETTELILVLINDDYLDSKEWEMFGGKIAAAAERGVPVVWLPLTDQPPADHYLAGRPDLTRFLSPLRPEPLAEMIPENASQVLELLTARLRDWSTGGWEIPAPVVSTDEDEEDLEEFGESLESEAAVADEDSATFDWALRVTAHLARAFCEGAVEGPELWGEAPRMPGQEGYEEERLLEFYRVLEDPTAANDLRHVRRMCGGALFGREGRAFQAGAELFQPHGRDVLALLEGADAEFQAARDASDTSRSAAKASPVLQQEVGQAPAELSEAMIERIARQLVGFASDKERKMMTGVLGYDPRRLLETGETPPISSEELDKLLEIAPQYTAIFHTWFAEFPTSLQRHDSFGGYLESFCELWRGYCETAMRQLGERPVRYDVEIAGDDLERLREMLGSLGIEAEAPGNEEKSDAQVSAARFPTISLGDYPTLVRQMTDILRAAVDDASLHASA